MEKFDAFLFKLVCWLCGMLMLAMLVTIFSQVVARYLFHHSLTWSEEIGRYLFVWISFLGISAAFKAGAHVALDLLDKTLKGLPKKILEFINGLLVIILASAIFYSGLRLFQLGMRQKSPALRLPMQWVYIIIPISGLLLLYFGIRALWIHYSKREGE